MGRGNHLAIKRGRDVIRQRVRDGLCGIADFSDRERVGALARFAILVQLDGDALDSGGASLLLEETRSVVADVGWHLDREVRGGRQQQQRDGSWDEFGEVGKEKAGR